MSKVTVVSTSLRPGSFSEQLAESFAKGAEDAGHEVKLVTLKGKRIGFCIGCNKCQESGRCIIGDDAIGIVEDLRTSDTVVWVTPVYYYGMSGQMKVLIDRANSLYVSDISIRNVYLLVTCADESGDAIAGTLKGVEGWVECLPGVEIRGTLCATGLPIDRDIKDTPFLDEAYQMGRNSL